MIIKTRLLVFTILPVAAIFSFLLSAIGWYFLEEHKGQVIQISSQRSNSLTWYFDNEKLKDTRIISSNKDLRDLPDYFDFLIVSDVSSLIKSEDDAQSVADLIKNASSKSTMALFDGSSLKEDHNGLYRKTMEDFLKIRPTGWSFIYIRTEKDLQQLDSKISMKIRSEDIKKKFTPVLVFINRSEDVLLMESTVDFSGKAPVAQLINEKSEVSQWVTIYRSLDEKWESGEIDLHLTIEGKNKLREVGLDDVIPLALYGEYDYSTTCYFSINIQDSKVNPGSIKRRYKSWYMEKIALFKAGTPEKLYWKIFMPLVKSFNIGQSPPKREDNIIEYDFKLSQSGFLRKTSTGEFENFYIKGVNLGPATPGRWFTEFPVDEHLYAHWFTMMKQMNLNTIRIYTLLPPSFYRSFRDFNLQHKDDPLYLIQEIWPEEHPPMNNLLDAGYNKSLLKEVEMNVNAVHGEQEIPPRQGRAWGYYNADISPWLIAYIIGRELEPDEVLATDELNKDFHYSGEFLSVLEGSPTESWLASVCDYTAIYEKVKFGQNKALGIVSWPTLDPLFHQSEWNDPELEGRKPFNDKAVLDINNFIASEKFQDNFFGAYHIYPNYPDFMNNQESYAQYTDSEGTFRYGGYLQEFMDQHKNYPALIAEFGLSTSSATAHINPDGYNHGGLPEKVQAEGIERMAEAIIKEGYAGAIIFEWIDEWAKKTWTTEPYMIPFDRQAIWHNALDPEQNYGILALEADSILGESHYSDDKSGKRITTWGSESHLYIEIESPDNFSEDSGRVVLGFDTYNRDKGSYTIPGLNTSENLTGLEFFLPINLQEIQKAGYSRLFSIKNYNTGLYNFASSSEDGIEFLPITNLVNRAYIDLQGNIIPEKYTESGILSLGNLAENYYSISIDNTVLTVRIPWGLLNVSDPSRGTVLDDDKDYYGYPLRDQLSTSQSESIIIYAFIEDNTRSITFSKKLIFEWKSWDVPAYRERPKAAYETLKKYFK